MTVVTIESLAAGGDGVARTEDGRVVFVPKTAVGDVVEIDLVEQKKSFARGAVRTIREAGEGRRQAQCSLFERGGCGGCQWLHIVESAQREAKSALIASALRHVAGDVEIEPVRAPTPSTHWRRRARFHWVRPKGSDTAIVGFLAPRSKRVYHHEGCLQIDAALESILKLIRTELAPFLHKRGEIDVVLGHDDRALVAVHGPHGRRGLEALTNHQAVAGVRGRGAPLGADVVEYDEGLPVSAMGFAQASLIGNRALVDTVAEVLDGLAPTISPRASVLELYAGSGNFTRALAARAERVVAVERFAGPRYQADNIEWVDSDSAEAALRYAESKTTFDVVVLDPPRSGAADCTAPLCELGPDHIVYVSCDPATLARDLGRLVEGGYQLTRVVPLDLMPQTSHVEIVALLRRSDVD